MNLKIVISWRQLFAYLHDNVGGKEPGNQWQAFIEHYRTK